MKPKIVVIKLEEPLSFESIDENDVDIVFALVPEDENNLHVDFIKIAELLEDKNFYWKLEFDSRDEIEKLIKSLTPIMFNLVKRKSLNTPT